MGVADNWNSPTPNANSKADPGQKDELLTQFNRSIAVVRDYTSQFEHDYARPALNSSWAFFEKRPISAVFIAFFSCSSLFPVIAFLGTSVFVLITFATISLGSALIAGFAVILGFLAILASILTATFFISIILTALAVFAYILLRFAILVRHEGFSSISDWADETKHHITGWFNFRGDTFGQTPSDVLSDSTSDSGVLLQDSDIRTASIRDDGSNSEDDANLKVQG